MMDSFVTKLDKFTVLQLGGKDVKAFLQNQLSSDVNRLGHQAVQLSAWCNPQGRILANFYLTLRNNQYYLFIPKSLSAGIVRRLGMFVLRSDVNITDLSSEFYCIGVGGKTLLSSSWFVKMTDTYASIRIPDNNTGRCILILPADLSMNPEGTLPYDTIDSDTWDIMDIMAGIPWITEQTSEKIIPQEIELEKLDGLSFQKGCFPGQEIIARIHYRGSVKYALYKGKFGNTESTPAPGSKIFTANNQSSSGTVISAVADADHNLHLLAILNRADSDRDTFLLENGQSLSGSLFPAYP